jgi:hypothetical protein
VCKSKSIFKSLHKAEKIKRHFKNREKRRSKGKLRSKAMPRLLSDAHYGHCKSKSTATSLLVHLNFSYWRCVEEVFDKGKILSSLLIFVLEWVIEINFKKINKGKDWQRKALHK